MPFDATSYASIVESLGAHALPAYLIALPMLMLSVAGVWWLARRYAMPQLDSKLPPSAYLLVRLAFGFAVMVAGASLFAELAEQIADADAARRMGELDTLFSITVGNHLDANARQAFAAITHLADTATLTGLTLVVAALLLAFHRRWLALAYVGAVAGNALLNVALKNIFERTRPIHDTTLFQPHGWSFPSGHSSGAVVAYGMLAYVLVRTWQPIRNHALGGLAVVLAASALAFTIGCSRIFIQVHYATDVLAGFSSGSMWLAMCIISIELTRHYQRRR
jgi:undecaprenyl-diphosphatase